MKRRITKLCIVGGIFIIFMTMSVIPIQASKIEKEMSPQTTQDNGQNILGYMIVQWDSWFARWTCSGLKPKINFTQSDTRVFYFNETGGFIQMNFTIVCKMRLLNHCLFPRWAQFEFFLPNEPPYIIDARSVGYCWDLKWKYFNITVDPSSKYYINPLFTNGSNATLIPKVGVRAIFDENLSYWVGRYVNWEPITVVPHPHPIQR